MGKEDRLLYKTFWVEQALAAVQVKEPRNRKERRKKGEKKNVRQKRLLRTSKRY